MLGTYRLKNSAIHIKPSEFDKIVWRVGRGGYGNSYEMEDVCAASYHLTESEQLDGIFQSTVNPLFMHSVKAASCGQHCYKNSVVLLSCLHILDCERYRPSLRQPQFACVMIKIQL